ncbi:hypothetical protein TSUD_357600 [Trifolium subterraneum]|uniref:Uncharacterized protein n=1 Tax=Trifolium subterraneum TaxID=3900 RepID=A0A2Z6M8G8_TRISU|nr:hypothetical protein TSUD_357600 [Trifolium subterraneum]
MKKESLIERFIPEKICISTATPATESWRHAGKLVAKYRKVKLIDEREGLPEREVNLKVKMVVGEGHVSVLD